MAAGKLNLTILQGATFRHTLTWTDANEIPVDLTDMKARMQIRAKLDSPTVLLELTTENDRIVISEPTSGIIQLFISAADTSDITWNSGVYDLEVYTDTIDPVDSEVTRLIEGTVKVSKEVTRPVV